MFELPGCENCEFGSCVAALLSCVPTCRHFSELENCESWRFVSLHLPCLKLLATPSCLGVPATVHVRSRHLDYRAIPHTHLRSPTTLPSVAEPTPTNTNQLFTQHLSLTNYNRKTPLLNQSCNPAQALTSTLQLHNRNNDHRRPTLPTRHLSRQRQHAPHRPLPLPRSQCRKRRQDSSIRRA